MDSSVVLTSNGTTLDTASYGEAITGYTIGMVLCLLSGYAILGTRIVMQIREKRFGVDDGFATAGLLLATGFAGASSSMLDHGHHGRVFRYMMATLAAEVLYLWASLFLRLSIVAVCRRDTSSKSVHYILNAITAFLTAYSVAAFVVLLIQRTPLSKWYAGGDSHPRVDVRALMITISVFDVATLIALLVLAMPLISRGIKAPSKTSRASAICFLLFAFCSLSLAIARIPTLSVFKPQPLRLPLISLITLVSLTISSCLVSVLVRKSTSSSLEEVSRMDPRHWRSRSTGDLSISNRSDTALFHKQPQTSGAGTGMNQHIQINVMTEIRMEVDERQGRGKKPA